MRWNRTLGAIAWPAAAMLALVACAAPNGSASPSACPGAATVAAASGCGGMTQLVAAARAEGTLNVIGLPRDWVNYGALLDGFQSKYGIRIVSQNPNTDSQGELDAVQSLGRSAQAPDVLDLRTDMAAANAALFAPYEVATWADIGDGQKDPTGLWTQDYGGFMAIGYDSAKVPPVASIDDLLGPAFHGKVALKGDPSKVDAALYAVMMANLAEGGSLADIATGVDFFHRLKSAGSFVRTTATEATVKSGATPVVFDWEFLSVSHVNDVPSWRLFVPAYPALATYFAQAINKNAPHPAAARLWEEYVFSDEGQNLWLKGGARPVRMAVVQRAGTVDATGASALPYVTGSPIMVTADQLTAARAYLTAHWSGAVA